MKRVFTFEEVGEERFLGYQVAVKEVVDLCSLGMIRNNQIDCFLPISSSQLNEQQQLKYSLGTMVSLTQFLEQTLSRKQILDTLISATKAIHQCHEWLLPQTGIVSELAHMYVNPSTGQIAYVYLPIQSEIEEIHLASFFRVVLDEIKVEAKDQAWLGDIKRFLDAEQPISTSVFLTQLDQLLANRFIEKENQYDIPAPTSSEVNESQALDSLSKGVQPDKVLIQQQKRQPFFSRMFIKQKAVAVSEPQIGRNVTSKDE